MGYSEMNCPHCHKINREQCNAWMYDTPIRVCKNCGKKYLDSRYREPAISGFDGRSTDPVFYLKGAVGFFVATIVMALWLWYSVNFVGHYNMYQPALVFACAMGTVGCLVMFIRIKLGIENKNNAKMLAESEKRLKDPNYVNELISYGYTVPDKYKNTEDNNG